MKKIFVVLILICPVLFAQVEYSSQSTMSNAFYFSVDASGFKSNLPNKTRMDFFVQVPYSSIQFVKKDDGFFANYNITLTFTDESKTNILFERNWKEKVKTTDFSQTLSKDNFNLSYKTYDLNPGKYFVKCYIEDSDSKKTAFKDLVLNVRKMSDTLDISDIMFISEVVKDSSGEKIIPNIASSVTNQSTAVSFYFDIYSNKDQEIYLEYFLDNVRKDSSFKQMEPRSLKTGTNSVMHTINNVKFSLGEYLLKVIVKDKNWKEVSAVEKKLFSKIFGIPMTITDINKAVAQMMYIASPEEINFIKAARDYKEMLDRFLAFWEKQKPNKNIDDNPILYEYYRRIEYANRNFKGLGEGWHSDMGMVYVTFGPPGSVERHPFDSDSKPYEIWNYYEQNRQFIFIDQTGFGDYRLYNTDYSRWPGYRQ